jgi:uncharacterized membrane protein YhdT
MKNEEIRKQLKKETIITIVLYLIYFTWWYVTAYGLGSVSPEKYTYMFGLPLWFVVSCVGGFILITTLVFFSVKYLFKDIDFDI